MRRIKNDQLIRLKKKEQRDATRIATEGREVLVITACEAYGWVFKGAAVAAPHALTQRNVVGVERLRST